MKTKLSNGPWKVVKVGKYFDVTRPLTEKDYHIFNIAAGDERQMSLMMISIDGTAVIESEADANLMAASRDLLKALQDLLWHVEKTNPEQVGWDFPARARAAIAKATA